MSRFGPHFVLRPAADRPPAGHHGRGSSIPRSRRVAIAAAAILLLCLSAWAWAPPTVGVEAASGDTPAVGGVHHRFEVAPGVWSFVPRFGGSTATVIVGDDGIVVVDPHSTPGQAGALAAEIRALSGAPVRWIVGSHWHGDHHGGAAALQEHWPEARLVEHPNTARDVFVQAVAERPFVLGGLVDRKVAAARARLDGAAGDGEALSPAARRQLTDYIEAERRTAAGEVPLRYVEPDVLVEDRLVLHAAGRTLEVRHPGPAHTEGDLYVWLPEERVLVAGDLLTSPYVVPRSGFPRSYARALRHMDRLPFDALVPGHGAPVDDGHERLRLMADFLDAVADAVARERAGSATPGSGGVDTEALTARVLSDPAVAAFEARIDWDEPLAMRFLDFPALVGMTVARALEEDVGHYATDIETGFVDIGGARLYYEARGDGEPVVLVHGGFMDARMWDPQFRALAMAGYRVIRYDLAGFGRTLVDDPHEPRSDADDLVGLLDALGVARAHVVGLSLGGTVAIDLAVTHPDRLRSLVAAETRPSGLPLPAERGGEMRQVFETAASRGREAGIEALLAHPLFATAEEGSEARARIRALVEDNFTTTFLHRADTVPAVDRLDAIRVPTLLVQGAPRSADGDEVARVLQEGIENLDLATIDGAGHMLNLERPAEFNRIVADFLGRHGGG